MILSHYTHGHDSSPIPLYSLTVRRITFIRHTDYFYQLHEDVGTCNDEISICSTIQTVPEATDVALGQGRRETRRKVQQTTVARSGTSATGSRKNDTFVGHVFEQIPPVEEVRVSWFVPGTD